MTEEEKTNANGSELHENQNKISTFMDSFEKNFVESRKTIKRVKITNRVFKLATIAVCLLSTTLFIGAVVDKNSSRTKFKKTQEYTQIVQENSTELHNKFLDGSLSTAEYFTETKTLSSNKFVDKKIKNSEENLDIKKQYNDHTAKLIAGACSVALATGLMVSKSCFNKKNEQELTKALVEEQFYRKFFFVPPKKGENMNEIKKQIDLYKKAFSNTSMAYDYYQTVRALDKLFAKYLCDIQILPASSRIRKESKQNLFKFLDILDKYTTLEHSTVSSVSETRHYVNFKTFNVPKNIQLEIKKEAGKFFKNPDEKTK